MSSKKRTTKTTKKISEPKIIYDDQIEQVTSNISTNIKGTASKAILDDSGSGISGSVSNTVKENTVKETLQEVKTEKKCPFSNAFLYNTLVNVKILGDKNKTRNGAHHMCLASIAKAVAINTDKFRVILVASKTAEAICSLILEYPSVLDIQEMPESYRKTIVARFKSDLKRFKF